MIKSFRHKGLQAFFEKGSKAGIQPGYAGRGSYLRIIGYSDCWERAVTNEETRATEAGKRFPTIPLRSIIEDAWEVKLLARTFGGDEAKIAREARLKSQLEWSLDMEWLDTVAERSGMDASHKSFLEAQFRERNQFFLAGIQPYRGLNSCGSTALWPAAFELSACKRRACYG